MEHRVSYAVIGAFVIILGGVLAAVLIWLAAGGSRTSYDVYAMYLKSQAGSLSPNSPVLYHGVRVGHVRSISLNPAHPQRAQVLLDIRENLPLKADTTAKIASNLLTGGGSVDLTGGAPNVPPLVAKPGQKYPVIPTVPGTLATLSGAVRKITGHLLGIADRLNRVLSDQNVRSISVSLDNIRKLTARLASRSNELASSIDNLNATMTNARAASSKLPALVAQLRTTVASYNGLAEKLGGAAVGVKQASHRLGGLAPQTETLLNQLTQVSRSLDVLLRQLQRHPNLLLFGRPANPGPGESAPSGG